MLNLVTDRSGARRSLFGSLFIALVAFFAASAGAQILERTVRHNPSGETATIEVTGRIVGPDANPIPNASVGILTTEFARSARPIGVYVFNSLPKAYELIGPVRTDQDGRFTVDVPPPASGVYAGLGVVAEASGKAFAMEALHPTRKQQSIQLTLGEEHAVRGQLIDLKGQPVTGANVKVVSRVGPLPEGKLEIWKSVRSDARGRFLLRGLNSSQVILRIEGRDFASQRYDVTPTQLSENETTSLSLSRAKTLTGTITYADTGQPASNALIVAPESHLGPRCIRLHADEQGHYRLNPFTPDEAYAMGRRGYLLNIFPPSGEHYLVSQVEVPEFRGSEKAIDVQLQRGLLVSGVVSDASSGEPIAGARIQFNEGNRRYDAGQIEPSRLHCAISDASGRYELPVPAKKGRLFVLGPSPDYVDMSVKYRHQYHYADAVLTLDPEPDQTEQTIPIKLTKGLRLKGRVVDSTGKSIPEFMLVSPSYLVTGYSQNYEPNILQGVDGAFELPGCDPAEFHTVYIIDSERKLGATAVLTAAHAEEPAVITLLPCARAEATFVGPGGKALVNYLPHLEYVLRDGAPRRAYVNPGKRKYPVQADQCFASLLIGDQHNRTDEHGRSTFQRLIPGMTYRIRWLPEGGIANADTAPWPHIDFVLRPNQMKHLGEIVVHDQ